MLPILFIGFRYNVGTDYDNYVNTYNIIKNLNFFELIDYDWELGGKVILKIASLFNYDKLVFILIAVFNLLPIFMINKMYNYKYLAFSILTYNFLFLPFCMNGMRQGISMSFILYSMFLLLNNKRKNSIIFFILAFLFHKSCILFLPYYLCLLFDKTENKRKFMKQSIVITLSSSFLILFFLKSFLVEYGILKYSSYINKIDTSNISFNVILSSIPILLIIFLSKKNDYITNTLKPIVISGLIFYIVGTSAQYLYRIGLFFTYFEIFLVPYIINKIDDKKLKTLIYILYIIYLILYFWYQFYFVGQHEIFPYQFKI